jgi:enoyl-CoA hydratase/carnithine racemase
MSAVVEDIGHVRVVTIDRAGKANAIDPPTSRAIGAAFVDAAGDPQVRVLVLTGAGDRHFSAGADLRSMQQGSTGGAAATAGPGIEVFTEQPYPKPVVAAVNGTCYGGGFGIALACDLVVAADHARFAIPEVQRGLVGVGVTSRVALRLPPAVVLELVLTGEPIDATRALALGLINRVVPAGSLRSTALELAERISANAPLAVRSAKEVAMRSMHLHDNVDLAALRALAAPVLQSEDAREGRAAFAEKRPPRFTGR